MSTDGPLWNKHTHTKNIGIGTGDLVLICVLVKELLILTSLVGQQTNTLAVYPAPRMYGWGWRSGQR